MVDSDRWTHVRVRGHRDVPGARGQDRRDLERSGGQGPLVVTLDTRTVARWLGVGTVTVEGSPTGGGWSNETIFVRADGRALVVRLTPADASMFPTYDLAQQVRCLQLAAAK